LAAAISFTSSFSCFSAALVLSHSSFGHSTFQHHAISWKGVFPVEIDELLRWLKWPLYLRLVQNSDYAPFISMMLSQSRVSTQTHRESFQINQLPPKLAVKASKHIGEMVKIFRTPIHFITEETKLSCFSFCSTMVS
jgi:hypothetical protein